MRRQDRSGARSVKTICRVQKDNVVGFSYVFNAGVSKFTMRCTSLSGGYLQTIDLADLDSVLQNDPERESEARNFAQNEKMKIYGQVFNYEEAKVNITKKNFVQVEDNFDVVSDRNNAPGGCTQNCNFFRKFPRSEIVSRRVSREEEEDGEVAR